MRRLASALYMASLALLPPLVLPAPAQQDYGAGPRILTAAVEVPARAPEPLDTRLAGDAHPVFEEAVTVALSRVRLGDALEAIAAASAVPIAFSVDAIPVDRVVSAEAAETPLGEVLRTVLLGTGAEFGASPGGHVVVFPGQPARLAATSAVVTDRAPGIVVPQLALTRVPVRIVVQGTITGLVTNAITGEPIPGANLRVVGTGLGAVTNAEGRYTIPGVPEGVQRIEVNMLGYTTQTRGVSIAPGETETVNFALEQQALTLEGVVAVGYGTQRRRDVTGSVASVSQERLEDLPNTSAVQAIQGATPGVSIVLNSTGAEPDYNILIRGQTSITASNDPLVVVDGIPYNGALSEINQSDIASIDILKDASAAAIYGARGANGVILITTKKGRIGEPRFNYSGYVGMLDNANMPHLMTGQEFADFKCEYALKSLGESCEVALTNTEREMLESGRYTDWYEEATRAGVQQQHTASLSGGSEETQFYVSGSALDTKGIAINDDFERYTLRANLDHHLGQWVDAGINTQLAYTDRSGRPAGFGGLFYSNPLIPARDQEGNILLTPWPEDPERPNPLQNLNIVDDDLSRRTLASTYVQARAPFLEGLSYRFNGGVDFLSRNRGSYWGRDTRSGVEAGGELETVNERAFDWTVENILRYQREFGAHRLDVTALYGAQAFTFEGSELEARGFPNDVLTYRQANVARVILPSDTVQESGLISQMGRLNYGYDGRYLLTFTARRDGFSGFGANYKYGVFPSVAFAWNLSEEPFWNLDAFDALKVRASWGQNGNHAIRPYQTLARLEELTTWNGVASAPGFKPATLGNPDLRWETTTSVNLGVDFGLFTNRITGTMDLYNSDTDDLLLDRLISPVHGIPRMTENIGRVRNRGVELALSVLPLETPRFSWKADFNITANRNEIVELYGDKTDDLANEWFIGESINTHFGWVFDGIWQVGDDIANSAQPNAKPGDARVKDLNGDGKIDVDDRTFLGTEDPSYTAGLLNTFRYGNLSLSAFFHSVQGVTRYAFDLLGLRGVRHNALTFDWWRPDNPINTRWELREDANPYEVGIRDDASFIRLKDLTLSYDLPAGFAERIGSQRMRIYANGRNLYTWTDWPLLDPEIAPELDARPPPPPGSPAGLTSAASHQRTIPVERVLSIGIDASF